MTGSLLADAFAFGLACMALGHLLIPALRLALRLMVAMLPYGLVLMFLYLLQLVRIAKERNETEPHDE